MHSHLWVELVYCEDGVGNEFVAAAVGCVEVDGGACEAQEQAVAVVRVGDVEGWVGEEGLREGYVPGGVGHGLRERVGGG